jgi:hypothetical protein
MRAALPRLSTPRRRLPRRGVSCCLPRTRAGLCGLPAHRDTRHASRPTVLPARAWHYHTASTRRGRVPKTMRKAGNRPFQPEVSPLVACSRPQKPIVATQALGPATLQDSLLAAQLIPTPCRPALPPPLAQKGVSCCLPRTRESLCGLRPTGKRGTQNGKRCYPVRALSTTTTPPVQKGRRFG